MTLKTVLNKVIVEPVEAETVTKGGILIRHRKNRRKEQSLQPEKEKLMSLWK